MAIDFNDEILQDFLIEAGEIIELLDGQLVDLELNPNDVELLNAIFRGFHTVKGGAGFLSIDALVALCHRAEDVFNLLRQGDLTIEQNLMDVILQVHDSLTKMFDAINNSQEPESADDVLIAKLDSFINGGNIKETVSTESTTEVIVQSPPDEVVKENESAMPAEVTSPSSGDDITDEEFENLLDSLHGTSSPSSKEQDESNDAAILKPADDDISEDEFEKLLDKIHGDNTPGTIINKSTELSEDKVVQTPKASNNVTEVKSVKEEKNTKQIESSTKQQETTVRVDTGRLDDIMNLVGELVLVRNRLATLETTFVNEEMSVAVSNLDLVTSDLQTAVMKTRMQPIKKVFGRFPRVVRDLSRSLNKEVELVLVGEDTDLDKNLVEALADPLVHLVRNSVDHGVEMPSVRESNNKPKKGIITLSAEQQGEYILLAIEDDGAGIDPDVIKNIAINKGVIDADSADRLSNEECYNLIFMPGFSTKENISDISGRGVGMDVVKTKITQLNGSIKISSEIGKGSKIEIKVPLTLAIMPTLMVIISGQVYALPLASVVEIFNFDRKAVKTVDGREVLLNRNKALPIYHLNTWLFNSTNVNYDDQRVVIVNSAGKEFGFVVDSLLGQEEVVIKPLGALLQGTRGISGATITGDGKISLILDVPGLMQLYANGI